MANDDGIIDNVFDPMMDTGKWRAMVWELLQELKKGQQHLEEGEDRLNHTVTISAEDVRVIRATSVKSAEESDKLKSALRRSVMQFFTGIGWIEKK
jgi:hypothetical protein